LLLLPIAALDSAHSFVPHNNFASHITILRPMSSARRRDPAGYHGGQ
jgi:hypothetical protein